MKIPSNLDERDALYRELYEACMISRSDRIAQYERLRTYYLWGCNSDSNPAIFNKILPQIDLLVSFLFSAETARFGINIDNESKEKENDLPKVPALTRRLNSKWHRSHCDLQTKLTITWSLVYNSMFLKLIQRKRDTIPYVVDPHNMGVLNEERPFLDDQDAFAHSYPISKRALNRLLEGHPKKTDIINSVTASMRQPDRDLPAGVQRIVMSQFPMGSGGPSGPGQLNSPFNLIEGYRAKAADEMVEMRELWIWDDDADDYRIATMASGPVCIFDRPNTNKEDSRKSFYLPGEHPFVQFCPNPSYDYFWGQSEVDRLTQLQDCRETRMQQIMELGNRQVKPPSALTGAWGGITDETNYALQVFGASIATSDPTAKVQQFPPAIPQDLYQEIHEYDSMFNEMMGLSNVVQGKGESGVRSKGHAAELARLGSARIKSRAGVIEDSLDIVGLHYLRLMQQHDPEKMNDTKGVPFTAEQFTKDYTVKVDGHSSSPIFAEDQKILARELFEARAITRSRLLKMVDPPAEQQMQEELKQIEAAEAAAAKAQKEAEAAKGLRSVK